MTWQARAFWYRAYVHEKDVARRKSDAKDQRSRSLQWHLPVDGRMVPVCKGFFLTTVGLKTNNDDPIRTALDGKSTEPCDGRGRKPAANRKDATIIREHIESYRPCAPHYRYLHAPNRRYLPSDITIAKMHQDFIDRHPDHAVGYSRYRQEVSSMNIGFTVLGHEECEVCKVQAQHNVSEHGLHRTVTDHVDGCAPCQKHEEHMARAKAAREEYRKDAERDWEKDEVVSSADLMKVSLIPILPHKAAFFTPRIIVFNETFSPLMKKGSGSKGNRDKPVAVLWHEAIAGRDAEDVAAAFWRYLSHNRDKRIVTLYVDNCSAQQKSWVFATVMITFVQQPDNATEKVTIKYLESGHTAMSADASHQVVQKKLARARNIDDYQDFVGLVEESGMRVMQMTETDFFEFEDGISRSKLTLLGKEGLRPHLRDVRAMQVRRGNESLFIKTSHTDKSWRSFSLLKATYHPAEPPRRRNAPRGINKVKIDRLCDSLLPLMPCHKRTFWRQLQTDYAKSVRDLTQ